LAPSETPNVRNKASDDASNIGQAVLRLRELILKGNFEAGERISELPLVALLGVSRTPIRLALERLAHEGLLEVYPTGGFIVRGFTLDDVWDSMEVRGALEGTAARLAAERLADRSELDTLRKCQKEMDVVIQPDEDSVSTYLELNDMFHGEVVRLAKCEMLRQTLDKLFCLPFASPSALVMSPLKLPNANASARFIIGHEHHHAIIDAIANREGARADALAREHARLTRRHLESALKDEEFLSNVPGGPLIRMTKATDYTD
jgi:GntR family transcriptional regulator, vanillate catabolism transcriptional regulator